MGNSPLNFTLYDNRAQMHINSTTRFWSLEALIREAANRGKILTRQAG